MIHFSCPCGKSLSVRDEHAGETMLCLDCDRELTIPGVEGVETEAFSLEPGEKLMRQSRSSRDTLNEGPIATKTSGAAIASIILGAMAIVLFCSVFTGLPAIVLGAIALSAISRSQGRLTGKGLAIAGIVTGALGVLLLPVQFGLLLPAFQKVSQASARIYSANNLKQIALAMHSYHDANGTLPPAAICDENGKRLLSWRVAVLPYTEEADLYHQFKLDEPWDGPNNSKLIARMPKTYGLLNDPATVTGSTYYRVFVGNGAAFDWCKGVPLTDFKGGKSNTILVAEAATAVPWTKPDELDFDPNGPLPAIGGHFSSGANVITADGAVHTIPQTMSPQTLKAAITRDAGDVGSPDW